MCIYEYMYTHICIYTYMEVFGITDGPRSGFVGTILRNCSIAALEKARNQENAKTLSRPKALKPKPKTCDGEQDDIRLLHEGNCKFQVPVLPRCFPSAIYGAIYLSVCSIYTYICIRTWVNKNFARKHTTQASLRRGPGLDSGYSLL